MAITPGAGFMVSPDNPNAVVPIGSGASVNNPNFGLQTQGLNAPAAPAATSAPTPAPQMQSPAVPQAQPQQPQQQPQQQTPSPVTVNVGTPQTQPQGQTQGTSQPQTAPPGTSLQPGAQGQDVQNLQNWLVQHGYLSADQIGTGAGVYGPQTTAAVALLQKDLGVNPGTGAGYYGPQTQQALAQKYGALHSALTSSGAAPDTSAAGREAVQGALDQSQNSNNPVMGALSASMAPIMQSLTQVLNNINNPALTATSLQTEYNQLRDQYGLPEMQSQLLNMNRIMNGTEQDIRDEVTAAGGFATESQVQGIAASRNKVILKQYNALSTQYDAAQQNVQAQMQYAAQDQSSSLQRQQLTASVTESLASIQNQMLQMGMTMQNNARSAAQYNVSQMGYKGLAGSLQGDPQMLSNYENLLGLSPGTLSNPAALTAMDTYKDQTLQLNNYKAAISAYAAGYGGGIPGSGSPTGDGGTYNTDPMTPSNPNGIPQGPGTFAVSNNSLVQPASGTHDVLAATGLSLIEFNYLTQGTSALSRYSQGQRMAINNSVTDWAKSHNVDVSTIQSQYEAYNKTLQQNISRFNNTKIAEGEVMGTLQNLSPAATNANLGDVNLENVAKIFAGQQVNDKQANEYVFYYNDLINSLAYFYAAQQGKSSADIPDKTEAAQVIKQGISVGGIQGLQTAVGNTTKKMETVLGQSVDSSQANVWNLLGVGDKYKSKLQNNNTMVQVKDAKGNVGTIPGYQLAEALGSGYKLATPTSLPAFPGLGSY